ncbi:hypothetical protein PSN45_002192 [Yamadazyma tenuis]|uniref:uncharacterized protein n=1 Tax=Candida tenuis TaxID=2315449 RepID=UPI0027A6D70B|nr:hypothetical protein PSN45_002192 [Yamadazyma tenuis]
MGTISVPLSGVNETAICSLYSLTQGNLSYMLEGGSEYVHVDRFAFPMFYITNCTNDVIRQYLDKVLDGEGPRVWPNNNGDMFISLLFTVSGTCCACWMLSVFLVLSPSHKRKPCLTQLSTVFYTIVLTYLLAKITDKARQSYYNDLMDVIDIHDVFFDNLVYRVTVVLSELLISMSFLQVIYKVSYKKTRPYVMVGSLVVVIAYLVAGCICEAVSRSSSSEQVFNNQKSNYFLWHQIRNSINLVFLSWVWLMMIFYTFVIKNPRKYTHCKRLLPLACFVWVLFGLHLAGCILLVAIYPTKWHNQSWLSVLRSLTEIGILSLVWEWIYNIKSMERRDELMGVLGRRLSVDDVTIFHAHPESRPTGNKVWNWLRDKLPFYGAVRVYVESENDSKLSPSSTRTRGTSDQAASDNNDNHTHEHNEYNEYNENENNENENNENENNDNENNEIHNNETNDHTDIQSNWNPTNTNCPPGTVHPQSSAPRSSVSQYEDEIINDYDFLEDDEPSHHSPPSGSSRPPPFQPHPGFSHHDYYPDQKH